MKKYLNEWWKSMKGAKIGYENEGLVVGVLKKGNTSMRFAWHRRPDTNAAR